MDKYPSIATERFDKANIWIKYILFQLKKYLKGNILEVGAGCGSFSRGYIVKGTANITLTENDKKNLLELKHNFSKYKNVKVTDVNLGELEGHFDTIIYFNVLEHIRDDEGEINLALSKLKTGGHLIILVPAHQKLYSNLDKAVGHFRRYEVEYFNKKFLNSEKVLFKYLDVMGYFLYFFNKIFFKNEVYPTKLKIFLWDKIFTPLTIVADFITRYNFGKNILCIYKKNKLD
jgi:SAM-dependent methyltransferase|tara:strand:+ start:4094 stop:4789 length:696 start_codon:yes stop_codon:yes gene_type:complete